MVFNPTTDIPDLAGKYILITGGTAGIGKESVRALAKHNPECIYFTGRDSKRADEIIAETKSSKVVFLECDLTSLASVQAMAQKVISETDRLDVLMCNAGVMNVAPALTKDGFEVHFGINHMAPLLIKLLLPTLLRTAEAPGSDVRIVSLSSQGFVTHPGGGIIFKDLKTTQGSGIVQAQRYGQSKLANLLYAVELARRYPQITSVSIHPGVVRTGLVSGQGMFSKALIYITNPLSTMTPVDGARNQLWVATADKQSIINGEYYEPVGKRGKHARKSRDVALAGKLWDWTENELGSF
ncbi:oxidoreductase [Roridomyces roridus]|uniref:Oxidoreductase n=1 Tax=Roridomyces roridus TaxID=1738132 RepID=A0AAD7B6Q4_9AGAR|nr:oxidoreductase [Roridomyces roridus]